MQGSSSFPSSSSSSSDQNNKHLNPGNPVLRFLRAVFIWVRNYLIFVGFIVTAIGLLFSFSIARRAGETSHGKTAAFSKKNPAQIELTLSGQVAQREPDFMQELMREIFGGPSVTYLPEVRSVLRRAAIDDRIAALHIEINTLAASWAEMSELHRILEEFKASKKPITVMLNDASDWNYYLASSAQRITINPATPVMIPGPLFQLLYFGEAVKKVGVTLEVVRAGKYKSAFEPFVRDEPTEATLEEYGSLESHLRTHMVDVVAKGRGKDAAVVRDWFKQSIFTASEALKAGLVDEIGYNDRTAEEEKAVPETVEFDDYSGDAVTEKISDGESVTDQGGIALIEAVGEINMQSEGGARGGEGIDPAQMHELVKWARETKDVKAVVLRVSSPGGSAVASDMIWHDINQLAQEKPLVVSMGQYAASGGYYISVPAKRVIAEPTTITGSIGVIGMLPSLKSFKEKYGVSFHVVTQSDRRELLNMGSTPAAEDKRMIEATIDQVYKTFLEKVAAGRKMKVADVDALAQGRVYTGVEALKLGLVDELGGMQAAFDAAKELAGFDVKKRYPVLRYESEEGSWSECLAKENPSEIFRCLRSQSSLGLPRFLGSVVTALVARVADANNPFEPLPPSGAEAIARLQSWIAAKPEALAIWPGYLSLQRSSSSQ